MGVGLEFRVETLKLLPAGIRGFRKVERWIQGSCEGVDVALGRHHMVERARRCQVHQTLSSLLSLPLSNCETLDDSLYFIVQSLKRRCCLCLLGWLPREAEMQEGL